MSGHIIGRRHVCDVPKESDAPDDHGLIWQCDICGACYSAVNLCGLTTWEQYSPSTADEIERLRALITEWADTFDVYPEVHEPDWHDRWDAANDALRKAVGR